ncbi:uncharacterized protein LOC108034952 [Drosophila biarmipes]|uniref:uncharacterized protein LOC108034952 n=1 Tax=Drosophila biarmipes TaxID=125945 RepID=UPI0007E867B6|nr:uncharacterized protein LOC108034952 [Drosophila biarmipes]XP_016965728.1 uncharacterized protein LOC108034952 [Drosophila biarmipes]
MSSSWYLQHVTTGQRHILHNGPNLVGRHSRCKIVLAGSYQFVSREHANIIVNNDDEVVVQSMNPLNGIFINDGKLSEKINRLAVAEGSTISLGVTGLALEEVKSIHAIFVLKKMHPTVVEVILSSDDDDTTPLPAARFPIGAQPTEFNLKEQIPNFALKKDTSQAKEELPSGSSLHLPKITEVKQEFVKQTTNEIQNIFGDPNDAILDSVLELNPYLYNQLNKNAASSATSQTKIHDGDCIELETDAERNQASEAQRNCNAVEPDKQANKDGVSSAQVVVDEDEYDERFAMSQAVLKEIKAEMAFGDEEEDLLESNGLGNMEQGSPSSDAYEDIVYISDSDDDELYDKVADWSKLLSQKAVPDVIELSQTYPVLAENSDTDQEIEAKRPSRALKIESTSEDDTSPQVERKSRSKTRSFDDRVVRQADSTTPDPPQIRKCSIRLKSKSTDNISSTADDEPLLEVANDAGDEKEDKVSPTLKSCLKTPSKTLPADKDKKAETNKSSVRKRRQTIASRDELADISPQKEETNRTPIRRRLTVTSPNELAKSSATNEEIKEASKDIVETPKKLFRSRSKSCYINRLVELNEPPSKKEMSPKNNENTGNSFKELVVTLEAPKNLETPTKSKNKKTKDKKPATRVLKTELKKTKTTTRSTPANQDNEKVPIPAETTVKKSPRLLNRSKSCYADRPVATETDYADKPSPTKNDATERHPSSKDTRITRGPSIIQAPSMPKGRGKLRGVSAQVQAKDKVLDRQRLIDYQAELNAKWKQKPKDKKKENEKIKENRREALKKLSDKPKEKEISSRTSKRKHSTSVPTVHNSNRGEFLTKEVVGPPTKVAKTDKAKPKPKNPTPPRRPTVETFSQQLQAADEATLHPQPHYRPAERKGAEKARNQRTCNKVTFAEMELYRQKAEELDNLPKKRRKVHFNDNVVIHYIEKDEGARSHVQGRKESFKLRHSTYRERREWARKGRKPVNDIRQHSRSILRWANQWLKLGSVDAVADQDTLLPISNEFDSYKHYKETFVPLMKLEVLTTIERDYKTNTETFAASLSSVYIQDNCYRLLFRVNNRPVGRFVLYTLSGGSQIPETFANLIDIKCVGGNAFDFLFEILIQNITEEQINSVKQWNARPVVDSIRVELGALSAVHQLPTSPLCRRILRPTQTSNEVSLPKQSFIFKGRMKMNEHQKNICLRTYLRVIDDLEPSITLIQGPPGTGKSRVISELCLQTLYGNAAKMLDRKILICAHSNTAIDHIVCLLGMVERIMSHHRFSLLRFGLHEKMSNFSRPYSLEAHFERAKKKKLERLTPENAEILKKQHMDLKAEILLLKQKANLTSTYLQQQLQQKERQLQLISEQLNPPLTHREESDISHACVTQANIICTTLSSCVKLANYVDFFDLCIIDEATQCTEPWTLLPMRFGLTHLVLVGDTQQLPAVVLCKKAIDFGLSNSMFDRIQRSLQQQLDKPGGNQFVHTKIFKLSMQYRMHPEICRWPNKYFYENQLVNAEINSRFATALIPYCVINLRYTQDISGVQNKSISNDEEARFVAKLLTEMDKHLPTKRYSYGIISPYQSQCFALSQVIPRHMNLTPLTVDAYQGLEKDVIIISNARTRGCGFLTNYQRLNVALTRPKRCLVICGNFDDLKSVDMWRQLLDDARNRKVYFDLDREHVEDLQNSLIKKMLVNPIDRL